MIEQVKQIVREASEIIKRAGDIAENTMAKEGTANYVTKYDLEVQKFLMKRLSETFEGCHFIGEEAGCDENPVARGLTFIIDPIDGTKSFISGVPLFGTLIAIGLWWSELLSRVLDPYLVVLNALPKTALGPVFIVWIGAGTESIIAMTIAISVFVTILNMHVGFLSTDREKIRLMQTLGATRHQILWRLVIPANYATLFNTLRVNVGLSWVGVIMGEFLVSKAGLGYLIVYGSQVFNMDLVMATVLVLAVAAVVMYQLVLWLEKFFKNRLGGTQ